MRTQVAIIGAGPAGLVLGRLLESEGIDAVLVESRSREYAEGRVRAGVLEHATAELLDALGVGERMHREGLVHAGIELRADGVGHRIDMTGLTGRHVVVYGQQEVVKDLIADRLSRNQPLLFDTECIGVEGWDTDRPSARLRGAGGSQETIEADVVVGADGFHGVCRTCLPPGALQVFDRTYPFGWLGIIAAVAPSTEELIYAQHPRGFALHSMRSPTVSRLYVQCEPDADIEEWSDARIWDELHQRLRRDDGWSLTEGPILDKSVTPMRSFVAGPMRHGRLFLAGDAAHIVPPTGAKGLNLAVADVAILGRALARWLRDGDSRDVDSYSDRALERVWQAQDFSNEMTALMHRHDDLFENRRQQSRLHAIAESEAASRWLSSRYVGLPIPTR